jgi:sulfatase modifying factor 1
MHGNVSEWCADWYGEYPAAAVDDPQGASSGSFRVTQGGGWPDFARYCSLPARSRYYPTVRTNDIGFRVARSSVP